jgi:hypothetical protein
MGNRYPLIQFIDTHLISFSIFCIEMSSQDLISDIHSNMALVGKQLCSTLSLQFTLMQKIQQLIMEKENADEKNCAKDDTEENENENENEYEKYCDGCDCYGDDCDCDGCGDECNCGECEEEYDESEEENEDCEEDCDESEEEEEENGNDGEDCDTSENEGDVEKETSEKYVIQDMLTPVFLSTAMYVFTGGNPNRRYSPAEIIACCCGYIKRYNLYALNGTSVCLNPILRELLQTSELALTNLQMQKLIQQHFRTEPEKSEKSDISDRTGGSFIGNADGWSLC